MLLAAGRGARLAPLTNLTPKPLLDVDGQTLIEHQIYRLRDAGFTELVINLAHLGGQIENLIGNGRALGVRVAYSREPDGPLETGGGIRRALPLLGDDPFAVVNSDVWTAYDYRRLPCEPTDLAHLVLVPNPEHNPGGDFGLRGTRVTADKAPRLTFAGIAVYRPELLRGEGPEKFPLAPLLRAAAVRGQVSGERYDGEWIDVGTPERLSAVRRLATGKRKSN